MSIDADLPRPRRAILATGLGALAGGVAASLARADVAHAGSDGDVVLGTNNNTANATSITTSAAFAFSGQGAGYGVTGFGDIAGIKGQSVPSYGVYGITGTGRGVYGTATGSGAGVYGESASGTGVVRTSPSIGVSGTSTTGKGVAGSSGSNVGVHAYSNATDRPAGQGWSGGENTGLQGFSGSDSPPSAPNKTGVHGYAAQDVDARGVHGQSTSGRGVFGEATTGQGLRGYATTGTALYGSTSGPKQGAALRTIGRVMFDKSVGVATIKAGTKSVTVTPGIDITSTSAVVATLQGSPGGTMVVQRVGLNSTADTFTIYLTANAKVAVKVAWHVFG